MGETTPPANRFRDVWPSLDAALEAVENCAPPITTEEWFHLSGRIGRNASPALLWEARAFRKLAPDALIEAVGDAWTGAEYPTKALADFAGEDTDYGREMWLELFGAAGFAVDGKPAPPPSEPVVVYRGAPEEHRLGLSWTSDLAQACWFADRYELTTGDPAPVWRFTAAPERVLAIFHEARNEAEYVVVVTDSDDLEEVQ
ncbi:MAG: hypothetical protein M9942_02160 [Microthrixaceae bacterium]|nr:hypothetical protein [Microthrixaceae bacterium]